MIIQIGTEVDESRILWKRKESDDWKRADIDDLIQTFESVVRCKDCKHYSVEGETTRFGWCGYWNKPTDEMRFCSDGERREESEVEE